MSDFEKRINADDLIEWIMEAYSDWCVGNVRAIVDHVEEMPSAQPDAEPVRHGSWIPEPDRRHHWHCSRCGYVIGILRLDARFCPNCGADMIGEDDG